MDVTLPYNLNGNYHILAFADAGITGSWNSPTSSISPKLRGLDPNTDADGSVRESVAADAGTGWITTNFLRAVQQGTPVACTFADALLSVEIIQAAFASAASQQASDLHAVPLSDG